jgi:competence protein ComEA
MSTERLRFARPRGRAPGPDLRVLGALLLVTAGALAAWSARGPEPVPEQVAVRVEGDVPSPGLVVLPAPARADDALAAAGRPGLEGGDRLLQSGDLLRVSGDELQWGTVEDGLVYGLPIDVNTAGPDALEAVPGIGPRTAARIIEDRDQHGVYESVDALVRVKGIGEKTVEQLRPFVRASEAP